MEEESNGNREKWPRQLGKMLMAIGASIAAAASHSQASSPRRFMEVLGERAGPLLEYQQICDDFTVTRNYTCGTCDDKPSGL